jgi:YVTN family beta-propeller protein
MSSDHRLRNIGTPRRAAIHTLGIVACLFAVGFSLACGGGSTSTTNSNSGGDGPVAAKVSGTITAGTNPTAIAADSTNNKIYVANFGKDPNNGICQTCYCLGVNGTLTAIDGTTEVPTTSGFSYAYQNPLDLAVNSSNHNLYVVSRVFPNPTNPTCGYAGELDAIDAATFTQTNTTLVGHAVLSERVVVNQNTGNVYVTDWRDSTITALDGGGNVLAAIALAARPVALAVNATTNRIYVTDGSSITVIDATTNSIISTITDPSVSPGAIAVNPATNTIYVATGNNLAVIDDASGLVTATIPVGMSPAAVAVDPTTKFIYVANAGNYDFNQQGSVTVINEVSNTTTTLAGPNLQYPIYIAVNPATNKIYVTNILSNNVTVIDGAHE